MTFHSGTVGRLARRRLRYAIAISLLLHLLIIRLGVARVETKDTPSPLNATLRTPPTPATPARLPPRAVPPAPTVAPSVPTPAPIALEQPIPPSVPQVRAAPVETVPVALSISTPVVAAPAETVALMTESNASGEAMDGLRGYRLAVATQARRFKRYPPQAMAAGWEGRADIRVEVGSDGQPRAAVLVRSSGYDQLDQAALTMIDAGALRARLPESLRGKTFAVALPVVFNLDEN